jgi:hypothetical protein
MFSDIDNHWAKDCILQLAKRQVSGYPERTYRPNALVTRAEFAVLMCNLFANAPVVQTAANFKDVSEKHWAYRAIKTASEKAFFVGYPDLTFKPNQHIPRVQGIIVVAAQLKLKPPTDVNKILSIAFNDAMQIPNYAKNMIAAATIGSFVVNYPNVKELKPNQTMTRGEVATLLTQALEIPGVPEEYIARVQGLSGEIRPLPGGLDAIPTFNSNSPEVVENPGILLSTFPPTDKQVPTDHLNYPFDGRFDVFTHHITRARTQAETHPFYQGILMHNPTDETVVVEVLAAASYLTSPEAYFTQLAALLDNSFGDIFSGPGSRVMNEVLRNRRQAIFPKYIDIPAKGYQMLLNLPIPLGNRVPVSNARSTMMRLSSNGRIYLANLAMKAPKNADGSYRSPTVEEWRNLLVTGKLVEPRDSLPTPLEPEVKFPIVFSRVAGVSQGTQWKGQITDNSNSSFLSIPEPGQAFSYPIATIHQVTLGTQQVQSAKMLVRYPDTAYSAHANYGIEYDLILPLQNKTRATQTISVIFSSPLKNSEADEPNQNELLFLNQSDRIFFRGTVRISYRDEVGEEHTRYFHLVQHQGHQGKPLVTLTMLPGTYRVLIAEFR